MMTGRSLSRLASQTSPRSGTGRSLEEVGVCSPPVRVVIVQPWMRTLSQRVFLSRGRNSHIPGNASADVLLVQDAVQSGVDRVRDVFGGQQRTYGISLGAVQGKGRLLASHTAILPIRSIARHTPLSAGAPPTTNLLGLLLLGKQDFRAATAPALDGRCR